MEFRIRFTSMLIIAHHIVLPARTSRPPLAFLRALAGECSLDLMTAERRGERRLPLSQDLHRLELGVRLTQIATRVLDADACTAGIGGAQHIHRSDGVPEQPDPSQSIVRPGQNWNPNVNNQLRGR